MKAYHSDLLLVTRISFWLLLSSCDAFAPSKQFQAAMYNAMNDNTLICHDGFMSVNLPKGQFADLPFTIYVKGMSGTRNISCRSWYKKSSEVFAVLVLVSTFSRRWTQWISPSCCCSRTVSLLPGRNWHLCYLHGCFTWMFREKTSEQKSHSNCYTVIFQYMVFVV